MVGKVAGTGNVPRVEVIGYAVQLALNIALTAWVVRNDERRLSPVLLGRAWNAASFWSAVVAFGPVCIPVHFVRTRRSLLGFMLGLGWMALVIAAMTLASTLLDLASDAVDPPR